MRALEGIKIQVWCKSGFNIDTGELVHGLLVKEVTWPVVPRVGERVVIHEGWCSEEVVAVHYHLSARLVSVEIRPDYSGEYAKEAKEPANDA